MAQTTKGKRPTSGKSAAPAKKPAKPAAATTSRAPKRREIGALICLLLAVFSFIGFFSGEGAVIKILHDFLRGLLGSGFFALPFTLLLCAVTLGFHRGRPVRFRVVSALLLTVLISALIHLFWCKNEYTIELAMPKLLWLDSATGASGGVIGGSIAVLFRALFSKVGAGIVFIALIIFFGLSAINKTIYGLFMSYRERERRVYEPAPDPEPKPPIPPKPPKPAKPRRRRNEIDIPMDDFPANTPQEHIKPFEPAYDEPEPDDDPLRRIRENDVDLDIPFMESKPRRRTVNEAAPVDVTPDIPEPVAEPPKKKKKELVTETFTEALSAAAENAVSDTEYRFPPIDLLARGNGERSADGSEEVRMNTERLESAFRSFGVNVRISNATRGPSVTLYEAELEAGVKLARLTSLADDIALSLGAAGVRIGPLPNRISTVGIEVPNKIVSTVYLRELFESPEFKNAKSRLTFSIGKNIAGESIVGNIAKLPHMLVAGTTGSGKSVCLNSLILSILYKATPDEVRFIMIDPKMVEFRVYNGIPHLLVPVVTDVKKAAGALQWAVIEMMRRYKMFADRTVRDLEGYNKVMVQEELPIMPQIVIVIDELADLMMTAAKDVEESVCRVAQMGRAAGVHLVIATQSPRADVITGLMKANIPSRIALKVSSSLESRIILDAGGGADKLVGNGDMLFAPIGAAKPTRIQGCWVTDAEREAVVDFVKNGGEAQYSEEVMDEIERAAADKSGKNNDNDAGNLSDYDEMLPAAADLILDSKKASTTMLQTRLKLGYARAARIIDQLEQIGLLGPFEGSKPRQILLTREQWLEMQTVQGTAPAKAPQVSMFDEPALEYEDGVPFTQQRDYEFPDEEDFDEDDLPPL